MIQELQTSDPYLPRPAAVARKTPLTAMEMMFDIKLDSGKPLGHMPGQFVEVSIPGLGEAPISISSSPDSKDGFQLVVRKIGRLTAALHNMKEGEKIGIRGPYGTCFPVEKEMKGKNVIFVAGGIGLAPLRSGIQYVLNHRGDYDGVTILYGTKSPPERLFVEELKQWAGRKDVSFIETVDKAGAEWTGNVGVITTLIPKAGIKPENAVVVACGPPVMYKFVIVSLYDVGIRDDQVFVSLERRMKCGVGKCGHCQINGLYACIHGPVFNYNDLAKVQEAI